MKSLNAISDGTPEIRSPLRTAWVVGMALSCLLVEFSGCGGEEDQAANGSATIAVTDVTELKGYTTRTFGSGMANRCVVNVPVSFTGIFSSANRIRYKSMGGKRLPPINARLDVFDNWDEHVQGFSRIAMPGSDNHWAAVSRASRNTGGGGFFLINLADVNGGDGGRWAPGESTFSGEPPADRRTQLYYPMGGTEHPGGLQSYGNLLAVAANGFGSTPSFVDIHQRRETEVAYDLISHVSLEGRNEPNPPDLSITAAGLARLNDARYLLFVLDKDDRKRGWFYVSDQVGPSTSMTWSFLAQVSVPRRYQNVTIVTECGTRDIYIIATNNDDFNGPLDAGTEYADLLKVNMDPISRIVSLSTAVPMRTFITPSGGYCTFRAAATAFVSKDGELMLYCHTHHANTDVFGTPDSKLKLAEYGPWR